VGFDEVTGGEGRTQTQFSGEDAGGDDPGELLGVGAGRGGVGTADAEEVEHGGLGFEHGAAADGADFDGRHGDGDLEVTVEAARGN
jgi:hypothetical protein